MTALSSSSAAEVMKVSRFLAFLNTLNALALSWHAMLSILCTREMHLLMENSCPCANPALFCLKGDFILRLFLLYIHVLLHHFHHRISSLLWLLWLLPRLCFCNSISSRNPLYDDLFITSSKRCASATPFSPTLAVATTSPSSRVCNSSTFTYSTSSSSVSSSTYVISGTCDGPTCCDGSEDMKL